jgi:hypothetical protein
VPEDWIQIENRPCDVCPSNIDRMTGQDIKTREAVGATPQPRVGLPAVGARRARPYKEKS